MSLMKIETLEFHPSIFSVWITAYRPVGGSVEDEDVLSGQSREKKRRKVGERGRRSTWFYNTTSELFFYILNNAAKHGVSIAVKIARNASKQIWHVFAELH